MKNLFTPPCHLYGVFILFLIILLNHLFIGCDTGTNGSGDTQEKDDGNNNTFDGSVLNAEVYQSDGYENYNITVYTGSGIAKIRYKDGDNFVYENIGTVTNGKLTFNLPSVVSDKYLAITSLTGNSGITVSPSDAKALFGADIRIFDGETKKGFLVYEKYNTDTKIRHGIMYAYFKKPTSIKGTSFSEGSENSFEINGKAGWNKLYQYSGETETGGKVILKSDLKEVPNDLKWILYDE
jgi:hypothetical protein